MARKAYSEQEREQVRNALLTTVSLSTKEISSKQPIDSAISFT